MLINSSDLTQAGNAFQALVATTGKARYLSVERLSMHVVLNNYDNPIDNVASEQPHVFTQFTMLVLCRAFQPQMHHHSELSAIS